MATGPGPQMWSRRSSWDNRSWHSGGPNETASAGPGASESTPGEETHSTTAATETSTWDDAAWQAWNSRWGAWNSWQWQWQSHQPSWEWSSSASSTTSMPESGGRQVELLPPFIQGWYLMTDAGLDHAERNLVMTALGGDFSPQRVAQELRNQFPETEVRRRDQGRRFQGFLGDIPEGSDEDLEVLGNTTAELLEEGLTAEGAALIVDAETQAQEALAVLHQARRTLKEARQRQHQVKQSRKYYTSGNAARSAAGGSR